MYENLDSDHPSFRWPMVKSRLERACTDFCLNLNKLAGDVHYAGASGTTIRGTAFTTYCTGRVLKPHAPHSLEWISDERLIEEFDENVEALYKTIHSQITYKRTLITWRQLPRVEVVYPPSIDDVICGSEYFVLPRVYYTVRLALEDVTH